MTSGDDLSKAGPEAIISAMFDLSELSDTKRSLLSIVMLLPALNIIFGDLHDYFADITDIRQPLL